MRVVWEPAASRVRLTAYERECGRTLDRWFATFLGVDAGSGSATVFALLGRRLGAKTRVTVRNPYRVEGAGWAGFSGFSGGDSRVATFERLDDGCRAAAVVLHDRVHTDVRNAYLRRDALALAHALEAANIGTRAELAGLASEAAKLLLARPRLARVMDRLLGHAGAAPRTTGA